MSIRKSIELVKEFHETFEHLIAPQPQIPSQDVLNFRIPFMEEELKETQKACDEQDLVQLADGLGDLQYVLDGFFLNAGLHHLKDAIMEEIHRSNMTKICPTEMSAVQNVNEINSVANSGDEVDYKISSNGLGYIIFRKRDGKIQKPLHYEKPNLSKIIYGE